MPAQPDPEVTRLACTQSMATVWNASPAAVRLALQHDVQPSSTVRGWMRARLALLGDSPGGEVAFPSAVAFPLVPLADGVEPAMGFAACRFATANAAAPPVMDAAVQRVLDWWGTATRQTVSAWFDVPTDADGTSAALAVFVAALLVREPELLPGFGDGDVNRHGFAATGAVATDTHQLRLLPVGDSLARKVKDVAARGYHTLFVIADTNAETLAAPGGLRVVPLPAEPDACRAALRRWFLSRLPSSSRIGRVVRRHGRGVMLGASLLLSTIVAGTLWWQHHCDQVRQSATALLAKAQGRADYFDWHGQLDYLQQAAQIAPELVPAEQLTKAKELALQVRKLGPPRPFAGIEHRFAVDLEAGLVVGATPTHLVAWNIEDGVVRWQLPRERPILVDVTALPGGDVLYTFGAGHLERRRRATGDLVREHDLPFQATSVAARGERVVFAGEGGLAMWDLATRRPALLPAVTFAPGEDEVMLLPDGERAAIVHVGGTAELFAVGDPVKRQSVSCPMSVRDWRLLQARDGLAFFRDGGAAKVLAWDVAANAIVGEYSAPGDLTFDALLTDGRERVLATLSGSGLRPSELVEWPLASRGAPPSRRCVVPQPVAFAGELRWGRNGRVLAWTDLDVPRLGVTGPRTINGLPAALGTVVTVDPVSGVVPFVEPVLRPTCLAARDDGKVVAFGCEDGVLRFRDMPGFDNARHVVLGAEGIVGCWWDREDLVVVMADGVVLRVGGGLGEPPRKVVDLTCRAHLVDCRTDQGLLLVAEKQDFGMDAQSSVPARPWVTRYEPPREHAPIGDVNLCTAWLVHLRATTPQAVRLHNLPNRLGCLAVGPEGRLAFGGVQSLEVRDAAHATLGTGARLFIQVAATAIAFPSIGTTCLVGDASGSTHLLAANSLSSPATSSEAPIGGHPVQSLLLSRGDQWVTAMQGPPDDAALRSFLVQGVPHGRSSLTSVCFCYGTPVSLGPVASTTLHTDAASFFTLTRQATH